MSTLVERLRDIGIDAIIDDAENGQGFVLALVSEAADRIVALEAEKSAAVRAQLNLADHAVALEAENATLKQERDTIKDLIATYEAGTRDAEDAQEKTEAERDRLRQAVIRAREFLQNWDSGDPKGVNGWFYEEFRNEYLALGVTLSPSETEEGG